MAPRARSWCDGVAMRHSCVFLLAAACTTEPADSPFADGGGMPNDGSGVMTEPAGEGTSTSSSDENTSRTSSSDGGAIFDLGAPDLGAIDEPEACELVDLVFVIDNSGSMAGEQENLIASFPGFVDGMLDALDTVNSFHIGVVPTDENTGNTPPCDTMGAFVTRGLAGDACGPYSGGSFMTEADPLAQ